MAHGVDLRRDFAARACTRVLLCRFAGYPGHYETIFGLRQEQVRSSTVV